MRRIYILLLIVIASIASAHDFTELYLKFVITPSLDMKHVNEIATVYKIDGDTAYAVVDEKGFYAFKKLEHKFKVIPDPSFATKALTMATTVAEMSDWDRYPTHDVYVQMMHDFATNHPSICKLDTIGFSVDGRPVLCVKISDNVNTDEDEPEFLYTGQMHGDEIVTYILFLRVADYILNNYGTDPSVTNIVNNMEIYINPLSNPDGTYNGGDNTVSGAVRTNANGVDLNRNYPNPTHGDHPDGSAWQMETVMMMDFATNKDFVMSANSHSGAELVNYPWDTWTSAENANADEDWWFSVSTNYADAVHAIETSYLTDMNNGVTQGKEWFAAYGTRQDYMNYYQNVREVTLELSSSKSIDASDLPMYWNYNKNAFITYLGESLFGIRGIITDACTGNPIIAKIEIVGHDHDGSEVYSSLPVGNYHRPILDGTYDLTFSAPNYETIVVNNVNATIDDITVINVQLNPSSSVVDFTADNQTTCSGIINFSTSISGFSSFHWDFGDGTTSTEQNPSHIYPTEGTYSVKLVYEICGEDDSLVKIDFINIDLNDAPTVSDVSTCEGATSFTLDATPVNNGSIVWYSSLFDSLDTGNSYTTPVLSNTTQYYAQEINSSISEYVGKSDNSGGGGYFNSDRYLIFDAYQDFTLKSVLVYSDSYGIRNIAVKDDNGTLIHQSNIAIDAGEHRVDLNYDIPAGADYQLKIESSNPDLYRNNDGINFPYNIADVLSIKQSDVGVNYYYYFYDWEIEYSSPCVSNMAEVNAIVNENPTASFDFDTNMNHVQFTNTSQHGTTYSWDFGDGQSSTEESPYHTYSVDGAYIVSLEVSNDCGTETFIDTVIIITLDNIADLYENSFFIYPNPAKTFVQISSDKFIITNIKLMDISGKEINIYNKIANNIANIDVSELQNGIYFVKILTSKNLVIIKKFVKENK